MFSCEYCEIFKNTYFEEHLQAPAFTFKLQEHKLVESRWKKVSEKT